MAWINVPFQLLTLENAENVMPLVEGRLNGFPLRLVVDTGASHTCLDKVSLKRMAPLALSRKKKQASDTETLKDTVMGVGGRRLSHTVCILPSLHIGELALHDYMVIAVRLHNVNKMLHWIGHPPIDGLLGCDVLQAYGAILDFSTGYLRFSVADSCGQEVSDEEEVSCRQEVLNGQDVPNG